MNTAKLTTTSGCTWSTYINGTDEEITEYFIGKFFCVSDNPEIETLEKVISVEIETVNNEKE